MVRKPWPLDHRMMLRVVGERGEYDVWGAGSPYSVSL